MTHAPVPHQTEVSGKGMLVSNGAAEWAPCQRVAGGDSLASSGVTSASSDQVEMRERAP